MLSFLIWLKCKKHLSPITTTCEGEVMHVRGHELGSSPYWLETDQSPPIKDCYNWFPFPLHVRWDSWVSMYMMLHYRTDCLLKTTKHVSSFKLSVINGLSVNWQEFGDFPSNEMILILSTSVVNRQYQCIDRGLECYISV